MTPVHCCMRYILILAALASAGVCAFAQTPDLPGFDFTHAATVGQWQPTHDISRIQATPEGMKITIGGNDPYTTGPALELPGDTPLWLHIRLKASRSGTCQVFYFRAEAGAAEQNSVRLPVPTPDWIEKKVPLPALWPRTRFRIDPPGTAGSAVIAFMRLEPRVIIEPPEWPRPTALDVGEEAVKVFSGDILVRYCQDAPGSFAVEVAGKRMAVGMVNSLIGYVHDGKVRWVPLGASFRDPDGADWRIAQQFAAGREPGTLDVEVRVSVSRSRQVLFLPVFVLLPGLGSFGAAKEQAVLPGLEYLADEPSSSEADIRGPASNRQVPDRLKLTFPLMAITAEQRYLGLIWEPHPDLAAVFDSPDRFFDSEGHIMGLVFPGSDGECRVEHSLIPYGPKQLEADKPLVFRGTLIGGRSRSVIEAVKTYVHLKGLPPVPETVLDSQGFHRLASTGWLDSRIREGDRFRHAVWQGFGAHPAADAAVWLDYLAAATSDEALGVRLKETARTAIAAVRPEEYYGSAVGHVRVPAAPLVYGHVIESVERARDSGRRQLARFNPDGMLPYRRAQGKPDYSSTHFALDANGHTAQVVSSLLSSAMWCGEADLVGEGLRLLRAMDKFAHTVPRGAQTWEIPLHTPDIMASAHLVRAYTLGYELTGDDHLLEEAEYWAWTGVPFVYLTNPTAGRIGPYTTIAVYGATNWRAPVWFGQPVQWCGLVYADALYHLARLKPDGPWTQLADGITAAGIQVSWKEDDRERQGLLPDFFGLREQHRDGPAINPATVMVNAVRLYGCVPVYGVHVFRERGIIVHVPGSIVESQTGPAGVAFTVKGWPLRAYYVLVSGLSRAPAVRIDGKDAPIAGAHQYLPTGNLVLQVRREARVSLAL